MRTEPTAGTRPNKTDAGNGSKAICRVSNVLRSPSPDPSRSATQMKLRVLTVLCVGLAYIVRANEPLWTAQERLEKRDVVLVGTVLSSEKIANIDKQSDLHLAVVEIEGMKKGKKTAQGSRVNVYYEFSVSGRNDRCPKYAEVKAGDKATFFLQTVTDDISKALRIKTVKEPALYLEMGSDVQKQIAEPDGAANGSQPIRSETNSTSSAAGSRR